MTKEEVLNAIVNQYKFMRDFSTMDIARKTDQIYGFVLGIGSVYKEYDDEIDTLWNRIRANLYIEYGIYDNTYFTQDDELLKDLL